MGAYYLPVCKTNKENLNPTDFNNGLKLMEHSYIGNNLVDVVLNEIYEGSWKNKQVVWACDYDKSRKFGSLYHKTTSISSCAENVSYIDMSNAIIINNTTKEYIDLTEYILGWIGDRSLMTHPFPLLVSAPTESMGGGDYHPTQKRRGTWAGHKFVVSFNKFDIPSHYTNITKEAYFYEEAELELVNDKFKIQALINSKKVDKKTITKVIKNLDTNASKNEVIEALHFNEESVLTFTKASGEKVSRTATLDKKIKSSLENNTKYLWFFDTDDNKLKKMIFDNFISLEKVA